MEIWTQYSDSHEVFFKEHFAASLRLGTGDRLISEKMPQEGSGLIDTQSWTASMLHKEEFLIEATTRPTMVVYSDCDVRWYRPTNELEAYTHDCDVALQDDGDGGLCAGFIIIVNGRKLRPVFEKTRKLLQRGEYRREQYALNDVLHQQKKLRIKKLPPEFWSYGQTSKFEWTGVEPLSPPSNIFIHHASWTRTLENKLKMLELVKAIVDERASINLKK